MPRRGRSPVGCTTELGFSNIRLDAFAAPASEQLDGPQVEAESGETLCACDAQRVPRELGGVVGKIANSKLQACRDNRCRYGFFAADPSFRRREKREVGDGSAQLQSVGLVREVVREAALQEEELVPHSMSGTAPRDTVIAAGASV